MGESALSMTVDNYWDAISLESGWGADYSNASAGEKTRIANMFNEGYRQFLYPPNNHEWSFLKPVTTLTVGPTSLLQTPTSSTTLTNGSSSATITITGSTWNTDYEGKYVQVLESSSTCSLHTILTVASDGASAVMNTADDYSAGDLQYIVGGAYVSGSSVSTDTTLTITGRTLTSALVGKTITVYNDDGTAIDAVIKTVPTTATLTVSGDPFTAATGLSDANIIKFADDNIYLLPDDFGFIMGDFTYPTRESTLAVEIPIVGEGQIRAIAQNQTVVSWGRPRYAAVRPLAEADWPSSEGQRWEALFWPPPDQEYTLTYRYSVVPPTISATAYPYGGAVHAETLLASCMEVVERKVCDGGSGENKQYWLERLASSTHLDHKSSSPEFMGYNADRSGEYERYSRGRMSDWRTNFVTYNGVVPS